MIIYACLVTGGAVGGWLARACFVRCNQYRMLKRLDQWAKNPQNAQRLIK